MPVQATIIVSGTVQSVGYREDVHRQATRRGLTGLVQNIDDWKVQIVVEGEKAAVDDFIAAISKSDRLAEVTDVRSEFSASRGCYGSFIVARDMRRNGLPETKLEEGIEYLKQIATGIKSIHTDLGTKMDALGDKIEKLGDGLGMKIGSSGEKIDRLADRIGGEIDKMDLHTREH